MAKKVYIGVENFTPRTLPSGYTQVEYIESSGTQYIDTGFKPNQNTKMILKMAMLADLTSKNATGVRNSSSEATNRFGVVVYTAQGKFGGFFGTNGISGATADTNVHEHELGPDGYIVDGVSYGRMSSTTFSVSYNLPLLSWSNGSNGNEPITGRLYSCQLYSGGTLVRDFIPCKNSSGVIGLYDLVNSVFYQNAGTGTFSAGSVHGSFARKIKKGYVGVEQASSYTLESNGTRDFIDGSVSVTSFSTYQINSNGTLTPGDPTTTTLDELWQYVESGANDLYFYFTGESSITECYQLYDYGLGNRTEYVYSVNVYVVTGSSFVQVARKIKKAYIGVGGVARPCWAGGELAYYGTIEGLSTARYHLAATTVGDYALFGGGVGNGYFYSVVDAYNTSLTRSTPTILSKSRSGLAATTVGDYALFGGGGDSGDFSTVDAYNTSLTRSTPTALSIARSNLAATTIGDYALFGGGLGGSFSSTVDAYNSSLTRSTPTALSTARMGLAATTVGDYALFGGGYSAAGGVSYFSTVDAYNTSLTRSTPTALSIARYGLAATTVGDYALFGGGGDSENFSVVDAYSTSLTRSTPTALSTARSQLAATTIGDYALFGGSHSSSTVDAYNSSLTRSTPTALSIARYGLAATTVGDYALFGGGYTGSAHSSVVDAYIYS